jgi:hypothetical protein
MARQRGMITTSPTIRTVVPTAAWPAGFDLLLRRM